MAGFSFSNKLFDLSATRPLRIDSVWRNVIVGGKAHGIRPDRHENVIYKQFCMNFVLRGKGSYTDTSGKKFELSAGMLFHRFPDVVHSTWYDPDSDYAEFYVVIDPATSLQLMKLGMLSTEPVMNVGEDPVVVEEFKHLCMRLRMPESQIPPRVILLEVLSFLNGLYERGYRNRTLGFWEKIIEDARLLLERNLDERVSVEAIADKLGVSYTAFRKQFKRATGLSPGDYRIRRRLESGQHLLLNNSVKQVAIALGYCDPFAFSAQFKSYLGISPSEFRQKLKSSPVSPAANLLKIRRGERKATSSN
jgi:AraC-like DNA-binding protein